MNNLTTRKIVLGMLATLVLAFGVQGVAEAITDPDIVNAPSGFNRVETSTTLTTFTFEAEAKVGGVGSISIALAPDKNNSRETVSISIGSGIAPTDAFYQLSGGLTEVDTNLTDANEGATFTYTAGGRKRTTTSTTVTIPIRFTTKGIRSVTISGIDNDGTDGTDAGGWSYKYTYYVKGLGTSTTTVSLTGLSNGGYKTRIISGDNNQLEVHSGDSGHYGVTYTTVPTGASLQTEQPIGGLGDMEITDTDGVERSSVFDVLLTMGRSYQVTAKVEGSDISTTGAYIIGSPKLTVGYPDNPDGIGGTAGPGSGSKEDPGRIDETLSDAFKVRVTDGRVATPPTVDSESETRSVPGVAVKFQVKVGGTAGGYLVFNKTTNDGNDGILVFPNNRERFAADGITPLPMDTAKILYVRTDVNGQAGVGFQLGTDRKQDVTISAVGQTKVVSAYSGAAFSGDQLVDPRSQSSQAPGRAGEYELRVKAEDEDGEALPNAYVEFRTSDGELEDPGTGEINTLGRLGVETDTRGTAFVFFDPKDSSGSPRVTAHLLDLGDDGTVGGTDNVVGDGGVVSDNADRVIDDVVFDISGGGDDTTPVNRLAISPTSISGDPDATRTITVTALNTSNVAVSNVPVTLGGLTSFLADGGTLSSTAGVTPFTSTFTYRTLQLHISSLPLPQAILLFQPLLQSQPQQHPARFQLRQSAPR